jgi:hypothetical protein
MHIQHNESTPRHTIKISGESTPDKIKVDIWHPTVDLSCSIQTQALRRIQVTGNTCYVLLDMFTGTYNMSVMFYYTCSPEHIICLLCSITHVHRNIWYVFSRLCSTYKKKLKSKTKTRTKNKKKNKQNVNNFFYFYVWGLLFQLFISERNKKYILCSRLTFLPNKC